MAFNKEDLNVNTETTNPTGATSASGAGATFGNDDDILGLGFLPTLAKTSEYVTKFKEGCDKFLKREDVSKQFPNGTILTLDRETPELANLAFSYIVLAAKFGDVVYNHILVLDATRRFEYENPAMVKEDIKQGRPIPIVASVLDRNLLTLIERKLAGLYSNTKQVNTNATFIPEDLEAETAGELGGMFGFYAIVSRYLLESGKAPIINLPKVAAKHVIVGDVQTGVTSVKTTLGTNKRADFKIEINGEDKTAQRNQIRSLNDVGSNIRILTEFGYIEYIPIIDETPVRYGLPPKTVIRPLVVINDVTGIKPFIDTFLTGILSATMLNDPNVLRMAIINNPKDIGVLNYIVNTENEKGKYGKLMKFKSGKYPEEVIHGFINSSFMLNPILAVEIDVFEENFDQKSPLAALRMMNTNPEAANRANSLIIDIFQKMIGAKIANQNVALNSYSLPSGYYVDAAGNKQDLRNISLVDVIEITKDPELIATWTAANLDGLSVKDQFECALDVYDKIVPNATITNERIRVILNPEFITEVAMSAKTRGFAIRPRTQFNGYQQADLLEITKRYAQYAIDPRASLLGGYQQQAGHAYTSSFNFVGGYGR